MNVVASNEHLIHLLQFIPGLDAADLQRLMQRLQEVSRCYSIIVTAFCSNN
jgi:hypothetical protein